MRLVIAFASLFYLSVCFGQDTKLVKEKLGTETEEYHVLKNDRSVRHGGYQKLNKDRKVMVRGYYKNGLKDSLWTIYHYNSDVVMDQGRYANDEKVGEWKYHDRKGALIQSYDHSRNELISFKHEEPGKKFLIKTAQGTDSTTLERPPMYIGGMPATTEAMMKARLRYPQEALDHGVSGIVFISFFVDGDGKAIEHQVHSGLGHGCDEEALRVIREIPDNWLPGLLDGQEVIAQVLFPVRFTIR